VSEPCACCEMNAALNEACVKYEKEINALRKVVEAARELTSWNWLHLLDDTVCSRDVRADVERLRAALAVLPTGGADR